MVIDSGTAGEQNYKVGDTIKVATPQPVRPFKLVGIAPYGSVGSIGSATFADLHAARRLRSSSTARASSTRSRLEAKPGVSQQQLVAQIMKPSLPLNKVDVR